MHGLGSGAAMLPVLTAHIIRLMYGVRSTYCLVGPSCRHQLRDKSRPLPRVMPEALFELRRQTKAERAVLPAA